LATALYYPFIHFKDDSWLTLSALYWDRMARIVPKYAKSPVAYLYGLERGLRPQTALDRVERTVSGFLTGV